MINKQFQNWLFEKEYDSFLHDMSINELYTKDIKSVHLYLPPTNSYFANIMVETKDGKFKNVRYHIVDDITKPFIKNLLELNRLLNRHEIGIK